MLSLTPFASPTSTIERPSSISIATASSWSSGGYLDGRPRGFFMWTWTSSPSRWRTVGEVELATLAWVHWWNKQRLHGYLADVPPAEFAAAFYASQQTAPIGAGNQ